MSNVFCIVMIYFNCLTRSGCTTTQPTQLECFALLEITRRFQVVTRVLPRMLSGESNENHKIENQNRMSNSQARFHLQAIVMIFVMQFESRKTDSTKMHAF